LVGQVEDEVTLDGRSLQPELDRLELECEIVGEGAVEAEMGLVLGAEEGDERPQDGEDRWLPATLFLGEPPCGNPDLALDGRARGRRPLDGVQAADGRGDRRQQ